MTRPASDINDAKRALARELRTKAGFVGVGVASGVIRLYAKSEAAPVVVFLTKRHGATYRGFPVSVVKSPGFRVGSVA